MASHGVFQKDNGEPFVEFLVQQCAISDAEVERVQAEHAAIEKAMGVLLASPNKTEVVLLISHLYSNNCGFCLLVLFWSEF
jgi:hypothetical protein